MLGLACAFSLTAQTTLSLPITSPRVIDAYSNAQPLSPAEKAQLALRNTFGGQAIANRLFVAGIDQLVGNPEEWGGGIDAYSRRFGSRMARLAINNGIRLGTDVAFGIDPRYDRCDCSGFRARAGHAWRRVLISRRDSGGEIFAISNFASAYGTPMIAHHWYPDRLNNWSERTQSGTFQIGWRGVTNMIREFWPEMSRKIPFRR